MSMSEMEQIGYEAGTQDMLDKIFTVISEMRAEGDFHNETLDEIEWRLT